jgi:hypothetical protein
MKKVTKYELGIFGAGGALLVGDNIIYKIYDLHAGVLSIVGAIMFGVFVVWGVVVIWTDKEREADA